MLAGLALRAVFVAHHPKFDGDTLVYGDLARNMLQHHVYGLTENVIRPTLIRLPGYPGFLAACFSVFGVDAYLPVLWIQVGAGLLSCWMLGRLGERLFGGRAGLVTLWLACLCPFTAIFDALALTETLSLFCVVACFLALERWRASVQRGEAGWGWAVGVGVALAYAVLLRPEQGLLAAAVIPAMVWMGRQAGRAGRGRHMREAALATIVCLLPLALWGVRNWRVFHVVQPLAPKYANDPGEFVSHGFNRWYRTWGMEYLSTVNTYWLYDGSALSMADLPDRALDDTAERAQTTEVYAAYNASTSASPGVDKKFGALAAERTRAHPLRTYLIMPVGRELDMWLRPRTEFFRLPLAWWRFGLHPWESLTCLAYGVLDWLLLAAAALGLWRWKRWWRDGLGVAMLGFVALRCLLLLTIDNSEPRYTLECFPVVFLLAALAMARSNAESSARRP
jgi:hypothetical protein